MIFEDYTGSKGGSGVWQRIISEMPPHNCYIEPFVGSGVVFRKKLPARESILIDTDPDVIQAWLAKDGVVAGRHAICGDAISFLKNRRFDGNELIYADPPYLKKTRSCQRRYYRCELETPEDHARLLETLKALPCAVMVSGYFSTLYADLLPNWRAIQIPTVTHSGEKRIEWVWMNFAAPTRLHDLRYIGANHRERWRIKKRVTRWQRMLSAMPALERAVLTGAILQGATPEMALRDPDAVDGVARWNAMDGDNGRRAPDSALHDRMDHDAVFGDGGREKNPLPCPAVGLGCGESEKVLR